nr:MAG TPA: hypothetical protein [Caudoviricetes sp.]
MTHTYNPNMGYRLFATKSFCILKTLRKERSCST